MALATLPGSGCGRDGQDPAERQEAAREGARRHAVSEATWLEMLESEELVMALGPRLRDLVRAIENLRLPDDGARAYFDAVVEATDLAAEPLESPIPRPAGQPFGAKRLEAGAPAAPTSPHALDLWRPLLDRVAWFDWAKLAVLRGRFGDEERRSFDTKLKFQARARLDTGRLVSLSGTLDLGWKRLPNAERLDPEGWRIARFETGALELQEVAAPFFRESLDRLVPDAGQLERARHSEHEAFVLAYLRDPEGFVPPTEHFHLPSHDRHPGIAVADVDGNGWDDVFVLPRWGETQLYLNQGDGRFVEDARSLGLSIRDHAAAALFADFDNDGDPDVFVARTLAPSVFLENRDGRFVAREDALGGDALPQLATSLAAADVNGDGLLDLYVSTYAANIVVRQVKGRANLAAQGRSVPDTVLEAFLDPADASRLHALAHTGAAHEYLSLPGPPNELLLNQGGGRFARVRQDADGGDHPLRAFANTYQATFADYDRDGDPDLYLAHDFSPNQFFRNDGEGRFRDVTAETGTEDIGFGMGVAWGDYDRDGLDDLYVTNMYSKAGNRITGFFDRMNPSFRKMARGNTLFRNPGGDGPFEVRSGEGPGKLPVEIAGWSWGGQFGDVDNDGFLDLYALSGYYTAPPEVESLVDI